MARIRVILLLLALAGFSITQGQEAPPFETSELLIYNVWVRPTAGLPAEGATPEPPLPGTVTGAYMTIENTSDSDYQLVAVHSDAAEMTHIHETTSSGEMSGMRMISAIDIPASETVRLESGGYHAMLMNVIHDVYPGEAVVLTLTFADESGATFDVPVAALATDLPPEEDSLIAANAMATGNEAGIVDVSLLLDNRGEGDRLVDMNSVPAATSSLIEPVDIPAEQQTVFAPENVIIRLGDFAEMPVAAFTLTLSFESGKELVVAVPIIEEAP